MTIAAIRLTGRLVRLVPLSREHEPGLADVSLDPMLWRSTVIRIETREEVARFIDAALEAHAGGTAVPFAITLADSGRVVGTTRFQSIALQHRRIEIGVTWIGTPWQRSGVNVEAKYLLLTHAFEALGCQRVEFKADAENSASCRALLRLGAQREGTLRRYLVSPHRGPRDAAIFSIIDVDWPAVKAGLEARLAQTGRL